MSSGDPGRGRGRYRGSGMGSGSLKKEEKQTNSEVRNKESFAPIKGHFHMYLGTFINPLLRSSVVIL